jgi:hypothetical protein
MRSGTVLLIFSILVLSGRAFAFGIDVGPVHIHGTKVKVGDNMDLKVTITKIVRDDDEKERVRKLEGHRKGDNDDVFKIKVVWSDLDDDSRELLKKAKLDTVYKLRLEKLDDDWKLTRIRTNDDE